LLLTLDAQPPPAQKSDPGSPAGVIRFIPASERG